jgi:PAS domain S-box-containing protein
MSSLNNVIFILNEDYCFLEIYQNEKIDLLLNKEYLLGKSFDDTNFPEPAYSLVKNALVKCLNTSEIQHVDYYIKMLQEIKWFNVVISSYYDKQNNKRLTCVVTDITARKILQRDSHALNEKLFSTIQSIGDGVVTCDKDGNILVLNKIAEKLTGWLTAEAKGKPIENVVVIVNSKTKKTVLSPVRKTLSENIAVEMTNHNTLIDKDGQEHQISESCLPIIDYNNELIGAILVFRDVTEAHTNKKSF